MTEIEVVESGSGVPLLFLPGSYSTPAAWRPLQKLLPAGYRLLSTSLPGYGASAETRSAADSGMAHLVRHVERLARRVEGPFFLVGHSFGGTVALATALAGTLPLAGLALFEANPLALIRERGDERLYRETLALSEAFAAAVAAGEADAAGRIIDFWGGPGSFAALPAGVRDYCRSTAATNVLDWRTDFGFAAGRADYARLSMPVLLVRGALANPAMLSMTAALAEALPAARSAVVPGAGHFLISSHPADCARLLAGFLADAA